MWSNKAGTKSQGLFPEWSRKYVGPLLLVLLPPPAVILFWYTNTQLDGSFLELGKRLSQGGLQFVRDVWPDPFDALAMRIVGTFAAVQLILVRVLPGPRFHGPITPAGEQPVYKDNGVLSYFVTLGLFFAGVFGGFFNAGIIYDKLGNILSFLNLFALFFCLFLTIKGHVFPSSADSGSTGNLIMDYYWGTELYPSILGWNVKQFTNCRFGMMFWPVMLLSYAGKQYETNGYASDSIIVSVLLQLIYCTKFFMWEKGYLRSIDIMHDRAGFMICWGCLVYVPGFYTSPTAFMVQHPVQLGLPLAALIFGVGVVSIYINWDCDRQRVDFREKNGKVQIWGKKAEFIVAEYETEKKEKKSSLLLHSGYWGLARHFHYLPELIGAFCWSCSTLFSHVMPFSYVIFLTFLLFDRAWRDDARCRHKYTKFWDQYCSKVPYKVIPGII